MRQATTLHGQFLRSVAASVLGFGVDVFLLAVLVELLHLNHLVANVPSFIAGTSLIWLLSRHWVFPASRFTDHRIGYVVFLCLAAIGLLLNEFLFWVAVDLMGLWYLRGKVLSACLVFLYNFCTRKFILFSRNSESVS